MMLIYVISFLFGNNRYSKTFIFGNVCSLNSSMMLIYAISFLFRTSCGGILFYCIFLHSFFNFIC